MLRIRRVDNAATRPFLLYPDFESSTWQAEERKKERKEKYESNRTAFDSLFTG